MAKIIETYVISIHALRGEGDESYVDGYPKEIEISIHALRGEGDSNRVPPYRGQIHFNPRPPWGGRLAYGYLRG